MEGFSVPEGRLWDVGGTPPNIIKNRRSCSNQRQIEQKGAQGVWDICAPTPPSPRGPHIRRRRSKYDDEIAAGLGVCATSAPCRSVIFAFGHRRQCGPIGCNRRLEHRHRRRVQVVAWPGPKCAGHFVGVEFVSDMNALSGPVTARCVKSRPAAAGSRGSGRSLCVEIGLMGMPSGRVKF